MPMHVRESHFVLTDVPMTFAVVLTLLLSLRASEQPTLRAFVAAGAAAGLAAGIKYNALMAFSMPLLAALALARGRRLSRVAAVLTAAGGLRRRVLRDHAVRAHRPAGVPQRLRHAGGRVHAPAPTRPRPSWLDLPQALEAGFGWPASLLAASGLADRRCTRIFAGPDRVQLGAARWCFPAVYFYLINGWGFMFARYALPIVPVHRPSGRPSPLVWLADRLAAGRCRPPGAGPRSPSSCSPRCARRDWISRPGVREPRHRNDAGAGLGVDEEVDLAGLDDSLGGPRAGLPARAVQGRDCAVRGADATRRPSQPQASSGCVLSSDAWGSGRPRTAPGRTASRVPRSAAGGADEQDHRAHGGEPRPRIHILAFPAVDAQHQASARVIAHHCGAG